MSAVRSIVAGSVIAPTGLRAVGPAPVCLPVARSIRELLESSRGAASSARHVPRWYFSSCSASFLFISSIARSRSASSSTEVGAGRGRSSGAPVEEGVVGEGGSGGGRACGSAVGSSLPGCPTGQARTSTSLGSCGLVASVWAPAAKLSSLVHSLGTVLVPALEVTLPQGRPQPQRSRGRRSKTAGTPSETRWCPWEDGPRSVLWAAPLRCGERKSRDATG